VRLDDVVAVQRLMTGRPLCRAQTDAKTQGVITVSSTLHRYNAAAAGNDGIVFLQYSRLK
jgi:hypothetical protein